MATGCIHFVKIIGQQQNIHVYHLEDFSILFYFSYIKYDLKKKQAKMFIVFCFVLFVKFQRMSYDGIGVSDTMLDSLSMQLREAELRRAEAERAHQVKIHIFLIKIISLLLLILFIFLVCYFWLHFSDEKSKF